jgi:hypothetical protein
VSVKQKDYFRFEYFKLKTLRVLWVLEYGYCVKLRDNSEESIASITLRGVIPVVYIRLIGREFYSQ